LRELEVTPPAVATRATLLVLLGLVAILVAWSLMAELDMVASAPGKLVPASQVKIVQAPDAGIVSEILVDEGDHVHASQTLVRLDSTLVTAENTQVANELRLKRLIVRAIDAELRGTSFVRVDEDPAVFNQVRAQFAARRRSLDDAVAHEQAAATRAQHERLAAQRQVEKLRETLPTYRQAAESFARLLQDGFIGELAANDKQREAIERAQDLKTQEATVEALTAAVAQSERRQEQLQSSFRADLLRERVEAHAAGERLEQERTKAGFRSHQLEVVAPQDGVVKDLLLRAPGSVVQAGTPLMRIVPDGDPLVAEAMLANEDVGFVEVGQLARIKLVTYPFQKYGMLEGYVRQISADASEAAEGQRSAPPLTYRALLELTTQQLRAPNGRSLDLTAGMAATVEIHQGRRTVMEFLLSPVQRVTAEAGRER
jgi:HlyD family secretion protein